jgi:hypothetical protein
MIQIRRKMMYGVRFQELMTRGYSIANKHHYRELGESEFEAWLYDCHRLLSRCEPEPRLPLCPDERHIEEIVMLLHKVQGQILRGQVEYLGIL